MKAADFRNLEFLNDFVTDGGQIVSRRTTKLQAKVHRHLARQIKTARIMALLPPSGANMHHCLANMEMEAIIVAVTHHSEYCKSDGKVHAERNHPLVCYEGAQTCTEMAKCCN